MALALIRSSAALLRFTRLRIWCLVPLLAMTAAQSHAQAPAAGENDLADAKRTILSVNADWIAAMRAGDAHRATRAYANAAVFVTREGRVLAGHDEIERAVAERMAKGTTLVDGALEDDGVQRVGVLVYEWGHSVLKWKTASDQIQSTGGQFLTVWKQMPDARWQIIRNLTL